MLSASVISISFLEKVGEVFSALEASLAARSATLLGD